MADTMQFDLVSPERSLASLEVTQVDLPGAEGDMAAMAGHAPLITTLRPGIVKATGPQGSADFVVTGGFAEITAESTTVLAERALPVSEVTQEVYDDLAKAAADEVANATAEMKDAAARTSAEVAALAASLGLTARTA